MHFLVACLFSSYIHLRNTDSLKKKYKCNSYEKIHCNSLSPTYAQIHQISQEYSGEDQNKTKGQSNPPAK